MTSQADRSSRKSMGRWCRESSRPAGGTGGPRSCGGDGVTQTGYLLTSTCMKPVVLTLFTRIVVPVSGVSTPFQPGW